MHYLYLPTQLNIFYLPCFSHFQFCLKTLSLSLLHLIDHWFGFCLLISIEVCSFKLSLSIPTQYTPDPSDHGFFTISYRTLWCQWWRFWVDIWNYESEMRIILQSIRIGVVWKGFWERKKCEVSDITKMQISRTKDFFFQLKTLTSKLMEWESTKHAWKQASE